ncbi:MAG: hypothetical protein IJ867_07245 [Clostridia bacterium]|nr:hypothetical protein [Clostridia bacterium]
MKKFIRILTLILVIALAVVGIVFVANRNNHKVTVNDYTVANSEAVQEGASSENSGKEILDHDSSREDVAEAVFSSLAKVIADDDADKVNAGITGLKQSGENISITINSVGKDVFDTIGTGDVFILDGNKETPFGTVYFGKVISKYTNSNGDLVVNSESPDLYEVFDELYVDTGDVIREDNIIDVKTFDGVSYQFVDNLEEKMEQVSDNNQGLQLDDMVTINLDNEQNDLAVSQTTSLDFEKSASILFDVNFQKELDLGTREWKDLTIDLDAQMKVKSEAIAKVLGDQELKRGVDDDSDGAKASYNLKGEEEKEKDYKKINEELTRNFSAEAEASLAFSVKGQIGFENVGAKVHIDFDVFNGGLRDVNASLGGNFVTNVEGMAKLSGEIHGQKTEGEFLGLDTTGLNQKMIPIAYFSFETGSITPGGSAYQTMGTFPLGVGALFYIDFNGEVKAYMKLDLQYSHNFTTNMNIVQDGKLVSEADRVKTSTVDSGKIAFEVGASYSGQIDIPGLSIIMNIGNLQILDASLVKLAVKFEGSAAFTALATRQKGDGGRAVWNTTTDAVYSASVKVELQFLSIAAKLKIKGWGNSNKTLLNMDIKTEPFLTIDLFKFGSETATNYDSKLQEYGKVTAKNERYLIYLNKDKRLVRVNRETKRTNIYEVEDVYMICGIDDAYLYVLKGVPDSLDLYRLNIEGGFTSEEEAANTIQIPKTINDKVLDKNIKEVLLEDDKYLYYIRNDEVDTIRKLNRSTENSTGLCSFPGMDILHLAKTSSGYYLAASDPSQSWMTFFGTSNVDYYNLDEDGNIVSEAEALHTENTKYSYKVQVEYVDHSVLRDTAADYNMVAENGTVVDLPTDQGWEPREAGVFVVQYERRK